MLLSTKTGQVQFLARQNVVVVVLDQAARSGA